MKSKLEITSELERRETLLRRAKATNNFEHIQILEIQIKFLKWILE